MARKMLFEYADAAYHVIARGNQGWVAIADNLDRTMSLDPLGETCAKTGWRMNAQVLTGNQNHRRLKRRTATWRPRRGWERSRE